MPAINPARLKQQTTDLAAHASDPAAFVRKFETLLELYANRIRRTIGSHTPSPTLRTYDIPSPVLRQIVIQLKPFAEQHLDQTLVLLEVLWDTEIFEARQIACRVLGLLPGTDPDPIFARIMKWAAPQEDGEILAVLFQEGTNQLRRSAPSLLLDTISEWLASSQPTNIQTLGLRGLHAFASDWQYENLPRIFRLLSPFVASPHIDLRPYLLEILFVLAKRSPQETVYILLQGLRAAETSSTRWLARKVLPALPEASQKALLIAFKT